MKVDEGKLVWIKPDKGKWLGVWRSINGSLDEGN